MLIVVMPEDNDAMTENFERAIRVREGLLREPHSTALRLFNGFYEGCPDIVVELYARTLVLYSYTDSVTTGQDLLDRTQAYWLQHLPWIECVLQKIRNAPDSSRRRGLVTFGSLPADRVTENGVWYAVDLQMHQDASFYLDTRVLRQWLSQHAAGWKVLNTFAYTGSLGVAALAGGARRVVQVDRNRRFMELARRSCTLNRFDLGRMKLLAMDFYSAIARFKKQQNLFDCVIVDPPFFSSTEKGTINLVNESSRLINKVRPLIRDGGWLVSINNALFLSGADYMAELELLCRDEYLQFETIIQTPEDVTGDPASRLSQPPCDPAPFNHPTKIAVLKVKRKEQAAAMS